MSEASLLSATDLTLSYGGNPLLDGASLAVHAGEKLGLVGRNGCGKSSFLRILAGDEEPDSGKISRRNGLVTGHLPQEFQLDEDASVEDNIREGARDLLNKIARFESGEAGDAELDSLQAAIDSADGWNLENRIETLRRELHAPPADRIVSYMSGGEKRRVGLCRALVAQPDLLILDEPTNHLDAAAIEWLEGYLANYRGACLFVTHDRYFLDRIATHIVELNGGRFFSHEGNYSDFMEAKAARQASDDAVEQKRQRFLKREIEWVRAGVKARGTKQRSRIDNFYAVKAQAAPEKELEMELIVPTPPKLGNIVLELEDLGCVAEVDPLFLGLNIEFEAGECVGIVGLNGAGKTTLLRTMMGEIEPAAGRAKIGKKTVFNYADQNRMSLNEELSILEEVADGEDFVQFGEDKVPVRSYLRRFLFSDERINDRIGHLSGGEKNRVLMAKLLRRGGNFLVLDEPTNDLDLQSLRVLEEALIHFTGTSVVVSHDRYFLDRVCDRILVFDGEGHIDLAHGNYSYYREKQKQNQRAAASAAAAAKPKAARIEKSAKRPRKLTFNETRELDGMEDTIMGAEAAIEELEAKLNDTDFVLNNPTEIPALNDDLLAQRTDLEKLYERWEELEAIRKAGG